MADAVGLDPRRKGGGGNGYHQASNQDEYDTILASFGGTAGDIRPAQVFVPAAQAAAASTKKSKKD